MNGNKKSKESAEGLDRYNEIKTKIGERVRELRTKMGYSQEGFANSFGIDRAQLGRIERGADLRLFTLVRVLEALDISFENFFKGFK